MYEKYLIANLIPLLEAIRKPGRYAERHGVNVLTNAAFGAAYNMDEVVRELHRAVDAGHRGDTTFAPAFSHPQQGLSFGLNPYTDWSISQLQKPPQHFYLFLGLDWYSISALGNEDRWFDYLQNPFEDDSDKYWPRIWAWIMNRTKTTDAGKRIWEFPILEKDAADFVRSDGGAFIFHNRIPYLRPAGIKSSKEKRGEPEWYETEWKKKSVRQDVIEDLQLLRTLADNRIIAFCTGKDSVSALLNAGYTPEQVISWQAHPSNYFHPSIIEKRNLWFKGHKHFVDVPTRSSGQ